jgi:hypothetical protein
MDLGTSTVRSLNDVVQAFDPTMVFWLGAMLALEFVTGVAIAFKDNAFDWDKVFDIAKKNVWMMVGWGAAFVYSRQAGNAVYYLALAWASAGTAQNVIALVGVNANGIVGQLLTRGPGDASAPKA